MSFSVSTAWSNLNTVDSVLVWYLKKKIVIAEAYNVLSSVPFLFCPCALFFPPDIHYTEFSFQLHFKF